MSKILQITNIYMYIYIYISLSWFISTQHYNILYISYLYIYTYMYILVAWQGHRGDRKKTQQNSFQGTKTKGACQATIIYKCTWFLAFSHSGNKGFPLSDCHQTLDSGSTIILPLLTKFKEIRSNRTEDMSRWILSFWLPYRIYIYRYIYRHHFLSNFITSKSSLLRNLETSSIARWKI